jgi:hypothetical protein
MIVIYDNKIFIVQVLVIMATVTSCLISKFEISLNCKVELDMLGDTTTKEIVACT